MSSSYETGPCANVFKGTVGTDTSKLATDLLAWHGGDGIVWVDDLVAVNAELLAEPSLINIDVTFSGLELLKESAEVVLVWWGDWRGYHDARTH